MTAESLVVALAAACVLATPSMLNAQGGAQNPGPIRALSVDAGYAFGVTDTGRSDSYYTISYHGKLLREKGTPFKRAQALDLLAPKSKSAGGDVSDIVLRYENNQAIAGGGLLSAIGAQEIPLSGLGGLGLRGTAQVGGDIKLRRVQAAVGLETPPARVPGLANTGISNWIVVGLNAERRFATDTSGQNVNVALATFRTFVGKAVGWRKSADVVKTAGKLRHDLLELAPTLAEAKSLRQKLDSIQPNQRTVLQQTLLDAITEAQTDEAWQASVQEMALGQADAITDQPTAALYGEWSGWVDMADRPTTGRFRSLLTVSLDYWFLQSRDDVLVRLRYELGYQRAMPDLRLNQLLASVGLRF